MVNTCTLRTEPEATIIEMKIASLGDIYNPLDPSPLEEKDLRQTTVNYLIQTFESAKAAKDKPVRIHAYLSSQLFSDEKIRTSIEHAIPAYFQERSGVEDYHLRVKLKRGRRNLIRGSLFLMVCIIISTVLAAFTSNDVVYALGQSIVVIGWVALWRPAEFYLYDSRDLKEHVSHLQKLAAACVVSEKIPD